MGEFFDIQEALEAWFGCKVDVSTLAMLKPHKMTARALEPP